MDFCDTSVIDWNAWSAVGTWVVGIAAVALAWKANSISSQLRRAEEKRNTQAAQAMIAGLRMETLNYAMRLEMLIRRLRELSHIATTEACSKAADAYGDLARIAFSDYGHRVAQLPNLPAGLATEVSTLYAMEKNNRDSLLSMEQILRRAVNHQFRPEQFRSLLDADKRLADTATNLFKTVDSMGSYLGLPAESNRVTGGQRDVSGVPKRPAK